MKVKYVLPILLTLALFLNILPATSFAQENPPVPPELVNQNFVLDELDWMSVEQEATINSIVSKLDNEGLAQIFVVTKDDCGGDAQRYRYDVFNNWGVGHQNDNDGLLIMVCWYGGDAGRRSVEQETGYGLEGPLPDTLVNKVVKDTFVPAFSANQPGHGLVTMVQVYDSILRGGSYEDAIAGHVQVSDTSTETTPESSPPFDFGSLLLLVVILVFVVLVLMFFSGWSIGGSYTGGTYTSSSPTSSPSRSSSSRSSTTTRSGGGGKSGGGGASTKF